MKQLRILFSVLTFALVSIFVMLNPSDIQAQDKCYKGGNAFEIEGIPACDCSGGGGITCICVVDCKEY